MKTMALTACLEGHNIEYFALETEVWSTQQTQEVEGEGWWETENSIIETL